MRAPFKLYQTRRNHRTYNAQHADEQTEKDRRKKVASGGNHLLKNGTLVFVCVCVYVRCFIAMQTNTYSVRAPERDQPPNAVYTIRLIVRVSVYTQQYKRARVRPAKDCATALVFSMTRP